MWQKPKRKKTKKQGISVTHWRVICDSPNLHYNPSVRCDGERLIKPQNLMAKSIILEAKALLALRLFLLVFLGKPKSGPKSLLLINCVWPKTEFLDSDCKQNHMRRHIMWGRESRKITPNTEKYILWSFCSCKERSGLVKCMQFRIQVYIHVAHNSELCYSVVLLGAIHAQP